MTCECIQLHTPALAHLCVAVVLARLLYLFEIRFEDHEAAVHGKTMEQILNHDTTTLMRRVNLPRFVLRPRFPTASVRTALEQTS